MFNIRSDKSKWSTPKDDVVQDVLNPAFSGATNVRIMAGFYSSEAIRELAYGLSKFITKGNGKLKIICSQHIDKNDIPSPEEAAEHATIRQTDVYRSKICRRRFNEIYPGSDSISLCRRKNEVKLLFKFWNFSRKMLSI